MMDTEKRPMILGIGGEGAAIIAHLAKMPDIENFELALIDTDRKTLSISAAEHKICPSLDWGITGNAGCGGDVLRGERVMARERQKISALLERASFLTVCGGLGGGTATGGCRTIASVARSIALPSAFLLTTPFSFEAYSRRYNAEECVKELLPITDILITLPNDLLFATLPPDTPAADAYDRAAQEMAHSVYGVAHLMHCKSLMGADYAAFMTPLKGMKCSCSLGVGWADRNDGLDRSAVALERLIASPFLGGLEQLKKSDTVFLILSGGTDLQIAELKRAVEMTANLFPANVDVLSGAGISSGLDGRIQLTAIAVRYQDPPEKIHRPAAPAATAAAAENDLFFGGNDSPEKTASTRRHSRKTASARHGELTQDEFALTSFARGIFENSAPNKYGDEDLDIPPFQRLNITIDRGKTGDR